MVLELFNSSSCVCRCFTFCISSLSMSIWAVELGLSFSFEFELFARSKSASPPVVAYLESSPFSLSMRLKTLMSSASSSYLSSSLISAMRSFNISGFILFSKISKWRACSFSLDRRCLCLNMFYLVSASFCFMRSMCETYCSMRDSFDAVASYSLCY